MVWGQVWRVAVVRVVVIVIVRSMVERSEVVVENLPILARGVVKRFGRRAWIIVGSVVRLGLVARENRDGRLGVVGPGGDGCGPGGARVVLHVVLVVEGVGDDRGGADGVVGRRDGIVRPIVEGWRLQLRPRSGSRRAVDVPPGR